MAEVCMDPGQLPSPFAARWEIERSTPDGFEARLCLPPGELFQGHFPGAPVLPGMYLLEALLQAVRAAVPGPAGLALIWRLREIVTCRFLAALLPGDEVRASFRVEAGPGPILEVRATARARARDAAVVHFIVDAGKESGDPGPAGMDQHPDWDRVCAHGRRLGQAFVRRVLPHRFPLLLVDAAALTRPDDPGEPVFWARKNVTCNEPSFAHLGSGPVPCFGYPETLIAESFCQSCGLLRAALSGSADPLQAGGRLPALVRLAHFRFFAEVLPGQSLDHRVRLVTHLQDSAVLAGESFVAGRAVARVKRVIVAAAPAPR